MNTYDALKAELRRLKKRKRVSDVSAFLAEYIYARLSLLDIVALIGGQPSSALCGRQTARLLDLPVAKSVATKALKLMQVSEDWSTFQHLYERAWGKREASVVGTMMEEAFSVIVTSGGRTQRA